AGAAILGSTSAECTEAGASLTLTTNTGEACLCSSLFSGTACDVAVDSTQYDLCTGVTDSTLAPNNLTLTQEHTTLNTIVDSKSVQWTVSWPVGFNRKFTFFAVGNCDAGTSLESFVQTNEELGCIDRMVFQMSVVALRANCEFTYETDVVIEGDDTDIQYARYSSDIIFEYEEPTVVGGETVTRSGQVTIPTSVLLLNRIAAVTTGVKVYSPFAIDTAITAQAINEGASTSYYTLTYALSLPYSVITMDPEIANGGETANIALLCTGDLGAGDCGTANGEYIVMPECIATDYKGDSFSCTKDAYIQLAHDMDECILDGTYTISDVVIDCYNTLPAADCPINQPNDKTTIEFTLASENFCGKDIIIEDAVKVDRFIFVNPENRAQGASEWVVTDPTTGVETTFPDGSTSIEALMFGGFAYARIDFSGLAVTEVTIVESQARSSDDGETAYTDTLDTTEILGKKYPQIDGTLTPGTDYTSTRDDPEAYEAGLLCNNLGLCAADQSFLVQYKIHDAVHAAFTNPGPGNSALFDLRLLVDVSYETNPSSVRRRRRQASTDTGNTGVQSASDPAQDGHGPASISASGVVTGSEEVAATDDSDSAAVALSASSFIIIAVGVISLTLF
ncbi:hypothetical protein SARC_02929, partial [Sphaeroforma arctica JP610]